MVIIKIDSNRREDNNFLPGHCPEREGWETMPHKAAYSNFRHL